MKDLSQFFNPKSIAIVGVPRIADRFGGGSFLSKFLECGFPGKLYPVNPKAREIQGLRVYPNLSSIPEAPDLAIVSVKASMTPNVLTECGRLGLRHIHILSSGFKEIGLPEGEKLEKQIALIAKEYGLLVIGPNCMGSYCPASRLTAWGAIPGMSGPVGIISQSGGITQRLTEYLCSLGIGTEKAVSIGNATVLDSPDYLEFMASDANVKVIAMYLESVRDGRRFSSIAREVCRQKPIILWKGGETEAGARTASSHTGAMAGSRELWNALYRQTGIVNVRSMDEWVDSIMALALMPPPKGNATFLVGGGGGNSVGNGDACVREGLELPPLSGATMKKLREVVPVAGSIAGNPLDMWRTFEDPDYLTGILELGYNDPNVQMLIVDRLIVRKAFHTPEHPEATPKAIRCIKANLHRKPTVVTADSEGGDPELARKGAELRAEFAKAGIPAYPSIERAARALARLHLYHRHMRA